LAAAGRYAGDHCGASVLEHGGSTVGDFIRRKRKGISDR
jgi:hypothetical protein